MIPMIPLNKTLRAGLLLGALFTLSAIAYAADAAKPQDAQASPAQATQNQAVAAPAPETPLHEIGSSPQAVPAATAPAAPAATTVVPPPPAPSAPNRGEGDDGNDRVSVSGSTYVGPDETVTGNAVAVMGPVKVDGTVDGNAVAVMGSNTINGTVHGNAVAVMGTLKLGPKSHVDGNAVGVVGLVIKEPGAYVGGNVVMQAQGIDMSEDSAASSWFHHGLKLGRPVAFGPHLHVMWIINVCLIGLYVLLALAFPNGVTKCGETLSHRPGITFLTGILSILGLPVLFILLLVTVVGIPIALIVLPLSILAAILFGKSAIYALVGRSILGKQMSPALGALVGALIILVLYFIPFLGLAIWFMVAFLGFACAVTTLFTSTKAAPPAPPAAGFAPPVMAAAAPQDPSVSAPVAPAPDLGSVPPPLASAMQAALAAAIPVPPLAAPVAAYSQAALPRAGFWIRMVALLLDIILIAVITAGLEHTTVHFTNGGGHASGGSFFPIAIATYGAILWKLKGSTIGGIIFNLRVVRVDDRPMDWTTAIVRALACFFSAIAAGLGFIWIAFDSGKQGWHDKIAGTAVVRHPKSVSLV